MTAPQQPEHCGHECCNQSMRVMGRDITTDEDYVCVKQNCPNDTRQRKGAEAEPVYAITESELKDNKDALWKQHYEDRVRSRRLSDMLMWRNGAQGQCDDAVIIDGISFCNSYDECKYQKFECMSDDVICTKRAQGQDAAAGKADYCKHLRWNTQIEGDGDYRCELGNKTSCEWCETLGKPSRCGNYCSASPGKASDVLAELERWIDENEMYVGCPGSGLLVPVPELLKKIAALRQVQQ